MSAYFLKRLIATIPVVFGVTIAVFAMMHAVPGDPVEIMLGEFQTSPEQMEQLRSQLHLDEPIPEQYGRFVVGAAHGDLGTSIRTKRPVSTMIWENLPSTIELTFTGLGIALILGTVFGVLAAIRQNSWIDVASMVFAGVGVAMPSFWLGIMLTFLFSLRLRWFPAAGGGDWRHLVLPALALGLGASAVIARLTRSAMLEVMNQDYIVTARAKGLKASTVVVRHALRNALTPVVTILGLQIGALLGGSVVIETVFGRPGIGRLIVRAILEKDFPVVQGVVLFVAVGYVLINLLVDVLYAALDPRISYR